MKQILLAQIGELTRDLAGNALNLRLMVKMNNVREIERLLSCRTEIMKSIIHRQAKLIEILSVEVEYREAA